MTLKATGACNLSCAHCSQSEWRTAHADYHMKTREIERLAARAAELGLSAFKTIHISGGEPTLWREFEDGCLAIKEIGLAERIVVSSNCIDYNRLIAALDAGLVDRVYCQASNASRGGVEAIRRTHPARLSVGRRRIHKPRPRRLLTGVLPARCGCLRPAYFAGRVYQCADIWPNLARVGLSIDAPRVWRSIEDEDWVSFLRAAQPARSIACRICVANRKVWNKI